MVAKQVFVPFALAAVIGAPPSALALALGHPASAQDLPALERQVGLERIEDAESSVAVVFEGSVNGPDGTPAEGAVVVSSAGGQAVTDGSGSFRLEARVPAEAESVQITAVGAEGGSVLASMRVALPAGSGTAQVGSLELAASTACSPAWLPTFGGEPGANYEIRALTVFDDGGGPALYAGGGFTGVGGVLANGVAKWDGTSWTALGSGVSGSLYVVHALAVYDDGGGPALYAGGTLSSAGGVPVNNIAKWDGSTWTPLGVGTNSDVNAMTVHDDGSGPALYAGGSFTIAGGVAANYVAKWDGSTWTPLGDGLGGTGSVSVSALMVYDDGGGAALYSGGRFTTAGGVVASNIAKWDGSSWSPLGSGTSGFVAALTVHDDGSGPALYAGGGFTNAGGAIAKKIAKWDGSSWNPLGDGLGGPVHSLTVYDDGGGPALHAGGVFASTGAGGVGGGVTVNHIAKWNGSSWKKLGSGMSSNMSPLVSTLAVYDDGNGAALYAGGRFSAAGGIPSSNIARWDGASWTATGSGVNQWVYALTAFDDGNGAALYAAGAFTGAGGVEANSVAKWDGSRWTPLGSGMDLHVYALTVFDDGGGPALYDGGSFTTAGGVAASKIAKWDGSSWMPLGSGLQSAFGSAVHALTVFDEGDVQGLIVGGYFAFAGAVPADNIARWDGTEWVTLDIGMNGSVHALTAFDDGSGPAFYAGGSFTSAGGVGANRIAKWDGSGWSSLGSGMSDTVDALAVYDDGSGPGLYAGGRFQNSTVALNYISKWSGSSWTPLGAGLSSHVRALTVHDDGSGPALVVGGSFTSASGVAASRIAKWDGSTWSALGSGMNREVLALTVLEDGSEQALYAGGAFSTVFDSGDSYLAKWGCAASPPTNYCTAGTSASGCQALLSATGTPSATAPSGFTLSASIVEGQKDGLFFFGTNGRQANPWGNGTSYQCVVPPVVRTPTMSGVGTIGLCDGSFALDLNALWCPSCPVPAKNPGPGAVVQAQLWYRDPQSTSNQTTSLSDAIELVVAP